MMRVPRDDMATFLAFKDAAVRPQGDTMEELAASMREAGTRTYEYFGALLDARDASGEVKEDLIGLLRSAEVDGEPLTRLQLLDITYLLMIAGLGVTPALVVVCPALPRRSEFQPAGYKRLATWIVFRSRTIAVATIAVTAVACPISQPCG